MTQRTREEIEREIIDVAGDRGWLRGRGKHPPPTPGCDQRLTELFAELAALAPDPQPAQEVREPNLAAGNIVNVIMDDAHDRGLFNGIDADILDEIKDTWDGLVAPRLAQPASEAWRAEPDWKYLYEIAHGALICMGASMDDKRWADYARRLGDDLTTMVVEAEERALAPPVEQAAPAPSAKGWGEQAGRDDATKAFEPARDVLRAAAPASTGEDVRERAAKFISEMTMRSTYIGGIAADALIFAGLLRTTPDLAATGGEVSAEDDFAAFNAVFEPIYMREIGGDALEKAIRAGLKAVFTALRERVVKAERDAHKALDLRDAAQREIEAMREARKEECEFLRREAAKIAKERDASSGEAERLREALRNIIRIHWLSHLVDGNPVIPECALKDAQNIARAALSQTAAGAQTNGDC